MNSDQGNRQALQQSLSQLRAEMSRLEFRDGHSKQRLEQLIAGIELHLESGKSRSQMDDLLLGAPKTIAQFEIEHPTLSASLRQLIATLSSMGI